MTDEPVQRRRPLIGLSGWVLFVCVFLPVIRVCGDPTAPIIFPPCYVVYLGGLFFGFLGIAQLGHLRRGLLATVVTLWLLTILTCACAAIGGNTEPLVGWALGLPSLVLTVWLVRLVVRARPTERAMMIATAAHGGIATIWYLVLSLDRTRMWGIWPGLAASIILLVAGISAARTN